MQTPTSKLNDVLSKCLETEQGEVDISPEHLAACAIRVIDEDSLSPVLVEWGCVLQLRQMSRALLRKEYDPIDGKDGQADMFGGLQPRYPVEKSEFDGEGNKVINQVYRERMHMSESDRFRVIARLEKEAEAKQQHADALRQETEALKSEGFFAA